jgi:hypothetical protein
MKFHPQYHARQKLPWTTSEERYLIENYVLLGPEEVSLALERTIQTVMQRACELRKRGLMQKPQVKTMHRRSGFGLRAPAAAN